MMYETWKELLQSKQRLSKIVHTCSPLEKTVLKANIEVLETKIMTAPEDYWTRYVKEGK